MCKYGVTIATGNDSIIDHWNTWGTGRVLQKATLMAQLYGYSFERLLKASGMMVKEIVFDLGFYDHANFAKFFKTHTGMSPSEFKEH